MLLNSLNEGSLPNCCYLCNECPNTFSTLDQLQSHIIDSHKVAVASSHLLEISTKTDKDKMSCSSNHENEFSFEGTYKGNVLDDAKLKNTIKESNLIQKSALDLQLSTAKRNNEKFNETEEVMNSPTTSDFSEEMTTSTNYSRAKELEEEAELNAQQIEKIEKMQNVASRRSVGYPCLKCPRIFAERDQLNIHYTHTHREKPQYVCDVCSKVFMVKRELSTHLRIHSGEQPHKCAQCGKEFGTRQLLKKHNMWHTGERSHVCPHCSKAFFQKGHLTQHLMIHKGGRPHQCPLCEKTFIFKFDLNRHMKIHAERGYSCAKCGKCFPKQSALDEHYIKCKRRLHLKNNLSESSLAKRLRTQSPTISTLRNNCTEQNFTSGTSIADRLTATNSSILLETKNFRNKEQLNFEKELDTIEASHKTIELEKSNTKLTNVNQQQFLNSPLMTLTNMLVTSVTSNANENAVFKQNFMKNSGPFNTLQLPITHQPSVAAPKINPNPLVVNTLNPLLAQTNTEMLQKHSTTDGLLLLKTMFAPQQQQQQQNGSPLYYCFICSKQLENRMAYMIHWSVVHFNNLAKPNLIQPTPTACNNELLIKNLLIKSNEKSDDMHSAISDNFNIAPLLNPTLLQGFLKQNDAGDDSALNSSSSNGSSPQKPSITTIIPMERLTVSPTSTLAQINMPMNEALKSKFYCPPQLSVRTSPTFAPSMESASSSTCTMSSTPFLPSGKNSPETICDNDPKNCKHSCKNCNMSHEKQLTLEKQLTDAQHELTRMREVMQNVGTIASALFNGNEKNQSEIPLSTGNNGSAQIQEQFVLPSGHDLEKLWVLLRAK